MSHPSRGAWIEMLTTWVAVAMLPVAPLTGSENGKAFIAVKHEEKA